MSGKSNNNIMKIIIRRLCLESQQSHEQKKLKIQVDSGKKILVRRLCLESRQSHEQKKL